MCLDIPRARLLGAACLAVLALGLSGMAAQAASSKVKGVGSMTLGESDCQIQATDEAREKALSEEIAALLGSYDAARHAALLPQAEEFVSTEKVRSFKVLENDLCEVVASFRFRKGPLTEALKATGRTGARVGAVLRYVVDGQLAEDQGINPVEAVRALGKELQKHNCELIDLLFQQDEFSQRFREIEVPLTANEGEVERAYESGLSHAEAVRSTLNVVGQELQRQLRQGNKGFDRVVSGQVTIEHLGKDPDSPNQMAQALISLSMHDVATKDLLTPTRPIPVRALGVDQTTARNLALEAAIETAVFELADTAEICAGT